MFSNPFRRNARDQEEVKVLEAPKEVKWRRDNPDYPSVSDIKNRIEKLVPPWIKILSVEDTELGYRISSEDLEGQVRHLYIKLETYRHGYQFVVHTCSSSEEHYKRCANALIKQANCNSHRYE